MSWQLAVFAGLALVIVGGFAWYERSRPPSRVVALVAALAALAVAGRLVLAPVPNVVATTDVAMLTGYALGGPPGFVVGALAAPISNIWLGQGPWTAWQMAGWGLTGLAGAGLGAASGRRLGRWGLALACALAGLAYGALLDLSVMVGYGGEQSLDRYLALSARGLPFNVVHAGGNFLIALAAGPALVRMISRFQTRLEFSWRPAGALPLVLAALATAAAVATAPHPAGARESAAAWLARAQGPDGGFAATPGQPSSPAMTGWAMLGLEAAGTNPLDVVRGGESAVDYLRVEAGRLRSVGDLERTILALTGAGLRPRLPGADLVADLRRRRDRDGSVDGQVNLTAFYVLALRAAGAEPGSLKRSAGWLRRAQNADGGWGIQPAAPSESDSTGAALQGLIAAGARGGATGDGARWLRQAQRRGGGWALGSSGVVNSQSTAWAVQGLVATGSGAREVDKALGYLARLRASDGHYRYSASSDQTPIWVTAQVLLAIERQPFPIPPAARAAGRSATGSGGGGVDSGGGASSAAAGDPGSSAAPGVGSADAAGAAASGAGGSAGGGGGAAADATAGPGAAPGVTASADAAEAAGSDEAASSAADPVAESAEGTAPPVSVAYPDEGSDGTTGPLIAGVAALAAIAGGAALWYRRRGG